MTTNKPLTMLLERPEADAPPMLKFDRRRSPRRAAGGHVTLLRHGHDTRVHRARICSIQLLNMSDGGLGGRCDLPLAPDEPVTVCIPPHGADRGFDLVGHVVRSRPGEQGYQVGIVFDARAAA